MCAVLEDGSLHCATFSWAIDPRDWKFIPVYGLDGSSPSKTVVMVEVFSRDLYFAVLGDGSVSVGGDTDSFVPPAPVSGLDGSSPSRSAQLVSGGCALLKDGSVSCLVDKPSVFVPVSGLDGSSPSKTAVALSSHGYHSCAVLGDGSVSCWGENWYGQLGDGSTTDRTVPTPVRGLDGSSPSKTAVAVSTGARHSCAVLGDGSVSCWGDNKRSGQLGNGTMISSSVPVPVSGLEKYAATPKQLVSSADHSLVVLSDGTVLGWGDNREGQVSGPSWSPAAQVVGFE